MLEACSMFVICLVTHVLDCYVFARLLDEKWKVTKKIAIIVLVLSIVDFVIAISSTKLLKFMVTNFLTFVLLKVIFKKNNSKTIVATLFIYVVYVIVEIFLFLIFAFFKVDPNMISENLLFEIVLNLVIFVIYLRLMSLKLLKTLLNKILHWYGDISKAKIFLDILFTILICRVLSYQMSVYHIDYKYEIIVFVIFIAILVFILGYFKEKSDNSKLTVEFAQLLDYVKDYEKEVVAKGKTQHEHKNQLGVIAGMIPKSNKKLNELRDYVDKQLNEAKKLDDNTWLEKITDLPFGGIKGLVYLKIKDILDKNIVLHIEVDKKLSVKKKWNSVNNNLEDYSRILGVYLDNAIEAACDSKDKQIIIEFIDNKDNIEFVLSNTYSGEIDFNSIDNEKYSTKGKNRGYGLSLVKDIIDRNKQITQKRELNGRFYVQNLYIKK